MTQKPSTKKSSKEPTGKKTFTFTLSLPAFIGIITATLLGFVWVFIFGLMVGRGYQPENDMPELKKLMPVASQPQKDQSATSTKKKTQTQTANKNSSQATSKSPSETVASKKNVLKAEELNFYDRLKKGNDAHPPAKSVKAQQVKKTAPKPVATRNPSTVNKRYEYVYQVAAFKEHSAAKQFVSRLNTVGHQGRITSGTANGMTWYRIKVHIKGNDNEVRAFKDSLTRIGVRNPLLKSKAAL